MFYNNKKYFYNSKLNHDTSSYYFIGKLSSSSLNENAKNLLESINPDNCNIFDNGELYGELISQNDSIPTNIFVDQQDILRKRENIKSAYNSKYNSVLSGFISGIFSS